MANQFFLYNNLIKTAVLTPSTVSAQYPVANLVDDRRTKVYRSTSNSDNIEIDLGSAQDINAFSIVHNGTAFGVSTVTIELNSTNVWTSPAVSQVITLDTTHGFGYHIFNIDQNYRYARIVLTSSLAYCEVSKIFLGKYASIGELTFEYPIKYKQNNNSSVTKNRLGQRFIDLINTQKEISGSISTMTKEEVAPLLSMLDFTSFTLPIWLIFPEGNITTDNDRINGYYYLKDDPTLSFVIGNYWNTELNFEEGK
jgi:hypothetical protein